MSVRKVVALRKVRFYGIWMLLALCIGVWGELHARSLEFGSPRTKWKVRKSRKPEAPGKNFWRNTGNTVFLDSLGQLHLKLRKIGNRWWAAEVSTARKFSYGEFVYYLQGDLHQLPPQAVIGMFLYQSDEAEIDIEITRWGKKAEERLLNYTLHTIGVLPSSRYRNLNKRFVIPDLKNLRETTHKITWRKEYIEFVSYHGHSTNPDNIISQHRIYKHEARIPEGKMSVRFNFYWFEGDAPEFGPEEYEVVLTKFEYKPVDQ